MKTFDNFMNERKGKYDYEIYHDRYYSAVDAALELAKKKGFDVDQDDFFNKVSVGPRKPSKGKTNNFTIALTKGGKPVKRMLAFQVYGLDSGRYELNAYIS